MRIPCVVDAVNQAGKGSGLAAAGGAGDKNHALGVIGKLHNSFRNAKFLWIRQLECDDTDNGWQSAALFVGTDTKTGNSGYGKWEIIITMNQQIHHITVSGHAIDLI